MAGHDESGSDPALERMVEFAHALPGSFSADIWLAYFAGVATEKRWLCQIEADLHGGIFGIWAESAQEATELAIREAGGECRTVARETSRSKHSGTGGGGGASPPSSSPGGGLAENL